MNYIALNRHPSFYRNQLSRKKIALYCQNSYFLGFYIPYVINNHCILIGCQIKAFRSSLVLTSHTYYRHYIIPKMHLFQLHEKCHQVRNLFLESKYYLLPVFIHKVVQEKGGRSPCITPDHFHTLCWFRATFSQSTRLGKETP